MIEDMKEIIELKDVTKLYGNYPALHNLNLKIEPGKIIGLLGPNGSGKTTLLKIFLRIVRQQMGSVKICGEEASYETRRFLSYMPDREFLYDYMTVEEAIKYYQDMFEDFSMEKAEDLLKKLDLNKNSVIQRLSKGNKEKVVLMLTLSREVPIYLLDEPLGSLDPLVKHQMLKVIKETINPKCTIILSTHLIKDTEDILDSVIFLKNGVALKYIDVEELKEKTLEEAYLEVFINA